MQSEQISASSDIKALLLTDVVDSTRLAVALGDEAMAQLWAAHDGLAKPTAARVMSLAVGGQTLLTAEARQALGATALALQSHGHWVMKGVPDPVELFEVGEPGTGFAAPPDGDKVYRVVQVGGRWLPVKELPNNLPQPTTSFIGREQELAEVKALLPRTRLLTLLGMGGLGKTRLQGVCRSGRGIAGGLPGDLLVAGVDRRLELPPRGSKRRLRCCAGPAGCPRRVPDMRHLLVQ